MDVIHRNVEDRALDQIETLHETMLLSEPALKDWNRLEEDHAWAYLQSEN